jgi:hypothetical protein
VWQPVRLRRQYSIPSENSHCSLSFLPQPKHQQSRPGKPHRAFYHLYRWYEFGSGRYTRADPAGVLRDLSMQGPASLWPVSFSRSRWTFGDQLNESHLFAYSANNPLMNLDPNGANILDYLFDKTPLACLVYGPACSNFQEDCKYRWTCEFRKIGDDEKALIFQSVGVNSESGFLVKVCFFDVTACQIAMERCLKLFLKVPKPTPS